MRYHKSRQLLSAEVFIGEKGRVHFVPTQEQTPKNVSRNHYRNVTEMVGAQGDTQEYN